MNTQSRQRAVSTTLAILTFAFFMVFFTKVHPIALFDTDSWYYAYYHRHPWPIWQFWNPTRVFPEVFMPVVSLFSAHVIYPLVGDYFFSLTIGYATVVSAAVTLLTWMVYRHFQQEGCGAFECAVLSLLFLICHFLILRSGDSKNRYMLLTENTCTHFYYVLPNLLNCTLVLWLIDDPKLTHFFTSRYAARKAVFLVLAYFCMFSNLWGSMIGGIFASVALLMGLIKVKKDNKHWFGDYLKARSATVLLLVLWLLGQWFEFNGRRANQLKNFHFSQTVREAINAAVPVLSSVSAPFLWMALILHAGGIGVTLWKKRRDELAPAQYALIAALLTALYLLLSCAVCAPGYISRPDTFYGLFFFVMLILLTAFRQVMRHLPGTRTIVPLCLIVLALECNTDGITYRNSMYYDLPASVCYQVDNDILQQLQSAVAAGESKTVLYVPKFNAAKNWPILANKSSRKRIPAHLYKMGLLQKNIEVTKIIPTEDKNREFLMD